MYYCMRILEAITIFHRIVLAQEYNRLEEAQKDWEAIQFKLDTIEPTFKLNLKKAIGKATDISRVDIIVDRKTFESALEKSIHKNRKMSTLPDMLRAAVLVDRKANIKNIIKGLNYYFDFTKQPDIKVATPDSPYGGAIHIDVLFGDIVCEIQIMSKTMYRYKGEADKIYKSKKLSPEESAKAQSRWFERGQFIEDIQDKLSRRDLLKDTG